MEFRRFGNDVVLRLDRGEEVLDCVARVCREEGIRLGSITGLGASDEAVVGLYDVASREYHKTTLSGPMEITSLVGNISEMDGEVYLHVHITLCDETMAVRGGHLNACRISATSEIHIRIIEGVVERRLDEEVTGLNIYRFL